MERLAAAHDAAALMIDTSVIRVHQHDAGIANGSRQHIGRFSPYLYKDCNQVERFSNRIKHRRGDATRYHKHAANYLAFISLACIRLWLRFNESTTKSHQSFIRALNPPTMNAECWRTISSTSVPSHMPSDSCSNRLASATM